MARLYKVYCDWDECVSAAESEPGQQTSTPWLSVHVVNLQTTQAVALYFCPVHAHTWIAMGARALKSIVPPVLAV